MNIRRILSGLTLISLLTALPACKKGGTIRTDSPLATPELSPDTDVRVHWLGKKRLGTMASAYFFTRLWEMPETKRLEAQTLQKLAVAPWRLLQGDAAAAAVPPALFGPLLEDIVREECYFELRRPTNQPEQFTFAVRVNDERAGLWRTNLVAIVASLTGIQTMDVLDDGNGWALKRQEPSNRFELSRVDGWTLLSFGLEKNELRRAIIEMIRRSQTGSRAEVKEWLQADFDLQRLRTPLWQRLKVDASPHVHLSVTGDGGNVLTHARLTFPTALRAELEPWVIPTNLLSEPLVSVTAVRSIRGLLSAWLAEFGLQIPSTPDQLWLWARDGNAFQTYATVPLSDGSNTVQRLVDSAMEKGNPSLAARGYLALDRLTNGHGVVWGNQPDVKPFFERVSTSGGDMLLAGFFREPVSADKRSAPKVAQTILAKTNLVLYDWEDSSARLQAGMSIGQFIRFVLHGAQFPIESSGGTWLRGMAPRLDVSETIVTRAATNQLVFERKSTTGFTGAELNLLADWLESPFFPRGLYSTAASQLAPSGAPQ